MAASEDREVDQLRQSAMNVVAVDVTAGQSKGTESARADP